MPQEFAFSIYFFESDYSKLHIYELENSWIACIIITNYHNDWRIHMHTNTAISSMKSGTIELLWCEMGWLYSKVGTSFYSFPA